ncbi:MAG: PQQ-dependent sugar dehydrogenase [Proteobacteria bacterium]|nr:PQQ-dependent sugar dehydrogenase [Pseudomonadota bacterium]
MPRVRRRVAAIALLCLCLAAPVLEAQTFRSEAHGFRVVRLLEGLDHPWSLAFLPDGSMLISERPGRLRMVRGGRLEARPIAGLPEIAASGQGGLLDVVPHPAFATNRLVYVSYAARGDDGVGTELARGVLKDGRLENVQVLFRQHPKGHTGRHFGGRVVFDRAGFVYLTLGDRGEMERAQSPDDHAGSVIRLHDDGRVPADNPFAGKPGWKPEKFTLGNRNLQGAALHPGSGALWTHEHGPQGGDEVNVIRAGINYGWPVISYGVNYGTGTKIGEGTHKPGMAQPLHVWVPSIAPSGMAFYSGDKFPGWRGDLFVGALKDRMLVRLKLDGEKVVKEERLLQGVLGRIRDVRMGPDGYLYLLTDSSDGVLARLEPLR